MKLAIAGQASSVFPSYAAPGRGWFLDGADSTSTATGINSRLASGGGFAKKAVMRLAKGWPTLPGKAFVALLLIANILLLDAMAACPALHELIHHDAGKPDHECAVTMFAHGQVDSVSIEVPVTTPQVFVFVLPQVEFSVFSPAIENLPAGRAPPVLPVVS
jgi:hypothetical protein